MHVQVIRCSITTVMLYLIGREKLLLGIIKFIIDTSYILLLSQLYSIKRLITINRYRKTNLFNEEQFNVTSVPEIVTFDTDFGVKFGTFICFDILFHEPALQLTRLHNITDIVYTTAWFSEVPFLTGKRIVTVVFFFVSTKNAYCCTQ